MKKLIILAVFYFFASNRTHFATVVGPFSYRQDCEKVRAWYGPVGSTSPCWESPN